MMIGLPPFSLRGVARPLPTTSPAHGSSPAQALRPPNMHNPPYPARRQATSAPVHLGRPDRTESAGAAPPRAFRAISELFEGCVAQHQPKRLVAEVDLCLRPGADPFDRQHPAEAVTLMIHPVSD